MGTTNISLPDPLRDFVEEQVSQGGYGTSSEYVRELIRRDKDRVELKSLLVEGARAVTDRRAGRQEVLRFNASPGVDRTRLGRASLTSS